MVNDASCTVKVLLADDHHALRAGLRVIIQAMDDGWTICGEATNGREAVELTARLQPQIVVMDMNMPLMSGLEAARQIKMEVPETEILMISGDESEELIRDAFEAGARSFLLKTAGNDEIEQALRALAAHTSYFSPKVGEILFARMLQGKKSGGEKGGENELTTRERSIVQLLAEGSANKEVADKLKISVKTVEANRSAIMKKLRLKTFSELVRWAIRNHIVAA